MQLIYILLTALCVFSPAAESIQCFSCHEKVGTTTRMIREVSNECGNFNETLLVTCSEPDEICAILQVDDESGIGVKSYECGTAKECKAFDGSLDNGFDVHCSSCSSDACNKPSIIH